MHRRRSTLTLASIAIAIAALGLVSGATPVTAQAAKQHRHCVKNLLEPATPAVCYDNFTAAMAAATDGQITDAAPDAGVAMKDQSFVNRLNPTGEKKDTAAIVPTASLVVVGILYSDADFGGSTYTFRSRPCTNTLNDSDYGVAYVGDDWNDQAESIKVFNNCYARLWQHRDFRGAMLDWAGSRSDFGSVMANEVSSLEFS
jgi:hypothetical protein